MTNRVRRSYVLLLLAIATPICGAPTPIPGGSSSILKLLGDKLNPAKANENNQPGGILSKAEPYIYAAAVNSLAKFEDPLDPPKDPNSLLIHLKNTESRVDQNGVPWARPPAPGSVDMERLLDERYYQRVESMIRSGMLLVDPKTNRLYYAKTLRPFDPKDVAMMDMNKVNAPQHRMRQTGEDRRSTYERYMDGDLKVEQRLLGYALPEEETSDYRIRKAYGIQTPGGEQEAGYRPAPEQPEEGTGARMGGWTEKEYLEALAAMDAYYRSSQS